MLHCAISGHTPQEPVVSRTTGHIFERRLIEKHLQTDGKCPITGGELSPEDLIPVNTKKAVKPRMVTSTSIPGLLSLFQNEWDAAMLETFTLKKHLDTVRQELSQALYQHDAACRVIARLVKERDEALEALSSMQAQLAQRTTAPQQQAAAVAMEVDADEAQDAQSGIPKAALKHLKEVSQKLSKGRKKRSKPKTLPKKDAIKSCAGQSRHKIGGKGIRCVDLHANQSLLALGGADHKVRIFDKATKKVSAVLSGHSAEVLDVVFDRSRSDRDVFYSCSADTTVRLWSRASADASYATASVLKTHSAAVTNLTVHATGNYVVTSSEDGSWAFHDVSDAGVVQLYSQPFFKKSGGFSAVQFHPDGILLGTGTVNGKIQIFDLKSANRKPAADFDVEGRVNSMSFSQNGYYMASGIQSSAGAGVVKLWDLRKQDMMVRSEDVSTPVSQVVFDNSGTYLSIAADNLRIKHVKSWNELCVVDAHKKAISGVAVAQDATFFATVSSDGELVFTAPTK